ncbi:MAG: serine/threonine-protein kinase, partial [Actinobacteria bacterium]|nr:serine/threonine-protein kinase [Actinomycetota bacterium]
MNQPVVINARYELGRRIGRGGMAEVFVARDKLLDRPVAVKILFSEYAKDPLFVERFRREAMSAAGLNHPNIVAVYDWGQVDTTYYIAMEYVQGRTLAEILAKHERLSVLQACDIALDVAGALSSAHAAGVVHRDIKPANVIVSPTGHVKVADFGIARAIGAAVEQGLTGKEVMALTEERKASASAAATTQLPVVDSAGSADDQPTTVLPTTTGRGSRGTTYPPYDDVIPRRTAAWVFGSVASILALVAVGLFTFRAVTDENAGANIIVPSVVGMNIEEAKSLLIDLGLVPIEDPRVRDDVPNDVVYEQTPPAETAAAQGDNVVLLYNPGFVPIEVPNLVGLSVEEATTVLKTAGLRLVVNEFIASTEIPANQIIVQTPTAGLGARP